MSSILEVLLFVVLKLFLIFLEDVPLKEFLFSLLLITLDRLPFWFIRDSVLFELLFLITPLFLFAFEPERARLDASTGSLLEDCWFGFLPTLDNDLVTGWLLAKEVSILLSVEVLESALLSEVGSSEASGELLGDPVDMGETEDAGTVGAGTVGAGGASKRSKNGFLLLFGEENGLVRPIVANFCPELKGLFSLFVGCCCCCICSCRGDVLGDKNGLVLALLLLTAGLLSTASPFRAEDGGVIVVAVGALFFSADSAVKKLSENNVSLCNPAGPFSEK